MEKYLHNESSELYYRVIGKGLPVVLIHGFCEYSHIWDPVLIMLEDEVQLLIPDLPGFGMSTLNHELNLKAYADLIVDMLNAEGINQAVVLGHSMGGYIAMLLTEEMPDRLLGLGLIHSHVYADSEDKKIARQKAIDFIDDQGAMPFIKNFVPGLFSNLTDRLIIRAEIASLEGQDASGLQVALKAMAGRTDTSVNLSKLPWPVLFVQGKHDTLLPMEQLLGQAALPSVSMVYVLENSGHMGMLEQPRELANAINEYLVFLNNRSALER